MSRARLLLFGLALILTPSIVASALGLSPLGVWPMVGIVFFTVAAMVYAAVRIGVSMVFAGVLGAVAAVIAGVGSARARSGFTGTHVADISVASAPGFSGADSLRFKDGRVRRDLKAVLAVSSRNRATGTVSTTHYTVAPVVPEGWSPRDPVPAWVATTLADTRWQKPWRAGIVIRGMGEDRFREAARKALVEHHLREAPGAPLLDWSPDPVGALRESWKWALGGPLVLAFLWIGGALLLGGE